MTFLRKSLKKFLSPQRVGSEKAKKSNVFENFFSNISLLTFFGIWTFNFWKKAKQKSRYTDIKNRRELCSRFKMMFYVTALKFKDGTVFHPITR